MFQGAMSNLLSGRIVAQKTIWTELTCHFVGEQAQGFVASALTEHAIQVQENEGSFGRFFFLRRIEDAGSFCGDFFDFEV